MPTFCMSRTRSRSILTCSPNLPSFMRQVLQHLLNRDIIRFIKRLSDSSSDVTEGIATELVRPAKPDTLCCLNVRFDGRPDVGAALSLIDRPLT